MHSWGRISWKREWLPTALFSPGEFHGHRSLEGYSRRGSQIVWHDCALGALCFIWHYSEASLCQMQHSYIIFFSRQENPLFERNQTQSIEEKTRRKHAVRGLGARDWKQASRELGRERRESRGRGLSAHLHNQNALRTVCSVYCLNLPQISFKHSISRNEPSSTNVKRSATSSSLGLTFFFFLILSALGVSFPLSVRTQAQSVSGPPFLLLLELSLQHCRAD